MKVLWITNSIFPDLSIHIDQKAPVVGGWMYGLAKALNENGVALSVATARPNLDKTHININGISYYLLKGKKEITTYDEHLEQQWKDIVSEINPDIVHIHGTEYAHGLSLIKACPYLKYVISIQGLISVSTRYFDGAISLRDIKRHITFRDIVKRDTILQAKNKFFKRGELVEKEYFKKVDHFIGRTRWDFDHTLTLNKTSNYHFCNESLRDSFYSSKKWDITLKKTHSIFLSQAGYPLKGLHQVLKAIHHLIIDFPNLKVRIAGDNIIKANSFKEKMALSGYGSYILHLVRKMKLENVIEFTGRLNAKEMISEYLGCHVFVCPSSIENSPNSLGEAQLLGTPCIASYVGGIPDMVTHGETGLLYRFEEVEMLAQAIKAIFNNSDLATSLSKKGILAATSRHNREENLSTTLAIYEDVISS